VYPTNPPVAAQHRRLLSTMPRKSDAGDTVVLAGILRSDLPGQRLVPADPVPADAIQALSRTRDETAAEAKRLTCGHGPRCACSIPRR
jgi:hypothetical protein